MRKSIFEIEVRVDINTEYKNLKNILLESNSLFYNNDWYSLYKFLNDEVFPVWKYKGLYIDFQDFLNKLDINISSNVCDEEKLLYILELLINLWPLAKKKLDFRNSEFFSKRVIGYLDISIPTVVEKLNYQIVKDGDKSIIIKRDADVDSVIDIVKEDCSKLLLEYNDIRNNTMISKSNILKGLDLYIEEEKEKYKSLDNDTYNSIQLIVNKMGINHPINEEPYKSYSTEEIEIWYDKCFKLMIHLIRKKSVNEINKERKKITGEQ